MNYANLANYRKHLITWIRVINTCCAVNYSALCSGRHNGCKYERYALHSALYARSFTFIVALFCLLKRLTTVNSMTH